MLACMIFGKSWLYAFALKILWDVLEFYRSHSVNVMKTRCDLIAHWNLVTEVYAAGIGSQKKMYT